MLYNRRNLIKELVTPDGLHINVKRYHKPFLNCIVYSAGIRKPKGLRAYEYPFILEGKGICTPEAIAYIEDRKWGLLQHSYFISIQAQGYSTLYDVGNDPVIERNLGNFLVWKHVSENIWFCYIVKNIHMLFNTEQVILFIHCHRSILKSSLITHS